MQEVAHYCYYYFPFEDSYYFPFEDSNSNRDEGKLRLRGYGSDTMVRDLMHLMPAPVPSAGDNFLETWNRHVNMLAALDENGQHAPAAKIAEKELSSSIAWSRTAVIEVLQMVD